MAKQIIYGEEARKKLKTGIDTLAAAVATTLGPKGRNVAIDKKYGAPSVVHDGVTVAKEIELPDPFENMGAAMVKEAASKINDVAGDGTTTTTILAQAIVNEGFKNIAAGANPMILKAGLEKASELVVAEIAKIKKEVSKPEEKVQIATISAGDAEIGKLIAEALEKVGKEGVVTVEESKGLQLEIDYREGMQLDKGYVSAYFVTNTDRMEAEISDAYILITDKKISAMNDLLPILEKLLKVSRNLVIIADDIDGEALAALVLNKLKGTLNVLAIKAPGFGDRRKEMLSDIAVLTGGNVISEELGRKLENVEVDDLGRADRVKAAKDESVIVGGKGQKSAIEAQAATIRKLIADTTSDYDKEKLQERLAKLTGGVAVISVGAATEVELKEKKLRVEDSVNATKAAIEEGVVVGGGVAFVRAREALKNNNLSESEKVGADILYRALEQPIRMLAKNAGADDGWVIREVEKRGGNIGFNVMTMEFGDLVSQGIIDPAKVSRSAVQNAVSVAMMVLTTEALITDLPEKKESTSGSGMGGMGGMDM
ncbi:MAG: chaperonin GroEL [candidate division WWE3 bacterium]|nr:chaperonin GroEL [candidate division WWE3 bacterium]